LYYAAKHITVLPTAESIWKIQVEREYRWVKDNYTTTKGGNRLCLTWCPGTLREISRSVDLEAEYEIFQRMLSESVHSTPIAAAHGPSIIDSDIVTLAWFFVFRFLGRIADYIEIRLTQEEHDNVSCSFVNFFDG